MIRVAVLIKQVARVETLHFDDNGCQMRDESSLEIDPYCRRAITIGVDLARRLSGECFVFTLAPASGEAIICDAIAAGAKTGVLISDPAFAGSDTLATSRALSAALARVGPFDLIISGKCSIDSDTGHVGPQVAQLLGLSFISNVIDIQIDERLVRCISQQDDAKLDVNGSLPLAFSVGEQLCSPIDLSDDARSSVDPARIIRLSAKALGLGPWGQRGSPTRVTRFRHLAIKRARVTPVGPLAERCERATAFIKTSLANPAPIRSGDEFICWMPPASAPRKVIVILPSRHSQFARELCTIASQVARTLTGKVLAFTCGSDDPMQMELPRVDELIWLSGASMPEDAANAITCWLTANHAPYVVLTSASLWGREVAARIAAAMSLGLVSDAIAIEAREGEIIGLKPIGAAGGAAEISIASSIKLFTMRAGISQITHVTRHKPICSKLEVYPAGRLSVTRRYDEIDFDALTNCPVVIGVGAGVAHRDFSHLNPLIKVLNADVVCTRRVADRGWIPKQRQVGLTGCNINPRLYVAIGIRGSMNHMIGVQRAGYILAINSDPGAPIFQSSDFGIIADWKAAVPVLLRGLEQQHSEEVIEHMRS